MKTYTGRFDELKTLGSRSNSAGISVLRLANGHTLRLQGKFRRPKIGTKIRIKVRVGKALTVRVMALKKIGPPLPTVKSGRARAAAMGDGVDRLEVAYVVIVPSGREASTDMGPIVNRLIGPTHSVQSLFTNASRGKLELIGRNGSRPDVFGVWGVTAASTPCKRPDAWVDAGRQAAKARGVDVLQQYFHVMYVMPFDCGTSTGGWYQSGTETYVVYQSRHTSLLQELAQKLLGYDFDFAWGEAASCANENDGLDVQVSDRCLGIVDRRNVPCSEFGNVCDKLDYLDRFSDPFDAMGDCAYSQLECTVNAISRMRNGWLPDNQIQYVTEPGVYSISALDSTSPGPQVLRVQRDPNHWYFIEYAMPHPIEFSSVLNPLQGVAVRTGQLFPRGNAYYGWWDNFDGSGGTKLIDAHPSTREFTDALFQPGDVLKDGDRTVTIRVVSQIPGTAQVSIRFDGSADEIAGNDSGDSDSGGNTPPPPIAPPPPPPVAPPPPPPDATPPSKVEFTNYSSQIGTVWEPGGHVAVTVRLSWTASKDPDDTIEGYEVYRDGMRQPCGTAGTGTSCVVPTPQGETYLYTVRAITSDGERSEESDAAIVTTPTTDLVAPPTPAGLQLVANTANVLFLTWDHEQDNGYLSGSSYDDQYSYLTHGPIHVDENVMYRVYIDGNMEMGWVMDHVVTWPTAQRWTNENVWRIISPTRIAPGHHVIQVYAYDTWANRSEPATLDVDVPDTSVPELRVTSHDSAVGSEHVSLAWDSTPGAASYKVYRARHVDRGYAGQVPVLVASMEVASFTDTNVYGSDRTELMKNWTSGIFLGFTKWSRYGYFVQALSANGRILSTSRYQVSPWVRPLEMVVKDVTPAKVWVEIFYPIYNRDMTLFPTETEEQSLMDAGINTENSYEMVGSDRRPFGRVFVAIPLVYRSKDGGVVGGCSLCRYWGGSIHDATAEVGHSYTYTMKVRDFYGNVYPYAGPVTATVPATYE